MTERVSDMVLAKLSDEQIREAAAVGIITIMGQVLDDKIGDHTLPFAASVSATYRARFTGITATVEQRLKTRGLI